MASNGRRVVSLASVCWMALLVLPSAALAADDGGGRVEHDLDARVEVGHDSNPFKLPESLSRGGAFGALSLRYRGSVTTSGDAALFADGRLLSVRYAGDVGQADSDSASLALGWETKGLPGFRRARFGARYGLYRMTFVDQATGVEAVSGGQSIGDRFDYDYVAAFLELDARASRGVRLSVDGEISYRDYRDDFEALGFDRLDYVQAEVAPGAKVDLDDGLSTNIVLFLRGRRYLDRRAEDMTGTDIPGSDLQFYYAGGRLAVEIEATRSLDLEFGTEGERRIDTASGFEDRTEVEIFGSGAYAFGGGRSVSVRASWSWRGYDDQDFAAVDEDNDGGRRKSGYRLSARYSHPVQLAGARLTGELRGRFDSFDNSDRAFSYRRWRAGGRLRARF